MFRNLEWYRYIKVRQISTLLIQQVFKCLLINSWYSCKLTEKMRNIARRVYSLTPLMALKMTMAMMRRSIPRKRQRRGKPHSPASGSPGSEETFWENVLTFSYNLFCWLNTSWSNCSYWIHPPRILLSYLWRSSCKSIVPGVPSSLASQTSSSFFPKEVLTRLFTSLVAESLLLLWLKRRKGMESLGLGRGRDPAVGRSGSGCALA